MSSILRALKKLENEPRHQEESPPLESKFVSTADTDVQRPVSNILLMVVGGGIVCGLVILAGWWFFSGKGQAPVSTPQKISLPDSRLNQLPTPAQSSNEEALQAVDVKSSIETPEVQKTTEQIRDIESTRLKMPVAQIIPQKDILPVEKQKPEEAVPSQEIPNMIENNQAVQHAEKPSVDSTGPLDVPPKTVAVEIPRLNDPDMKLQAITWSREPQKRITVINNRILRERDIVSGYLIKAINQDDVVLSRDGKKWKIVFH